MATSTEGAAAPSAAKSRQFPCESCGADLEFHIGAQTLKCPYCSFEKVMEVPAGTAAEQDLNATFDRLREQRKSKGTGDSSGPLNKELTCGDCGATTVFEGSLATSACAYCASPLHLEGAHTAPERIAVDGVLPFGVTQESAREGLKTWVRSRWFAPNDFKKKGANGRFNGVYLPYFTFDAMTVSHYSGERGTTYTTTEGSGKNRRTVTRTRWQSVSGTVQSFFDDVLVCTLEKINHKLVRDLEPWPLEKLKPYQSELLAGYQSRVYEVDLPAGFAIGKVRIDEGIRALVQSDIGGDKQRIDAVNTDYSAMTYKHILLPLWMLSYRFGDKVYQLVVNAQTGEVQGERPWSWVKIGLAVGLGLGLLAVIMYLNARAG